MVVVCAMRQRLVANFDVCTGCRICQLICSFEREGGFNPRHAHLRVEGVHNAVFNDIVVCTQCENAACMRVCPVEGALYRDSTTHAVVVDVEECTGCGQCALYCSIGMIVVDEATGKARKCDLCGGDPLCVRHCPAGALFVATIPSKED